jgi:hypothetical protein
VRGLNLIREKVVLFNLYRERLGRCGSWLIVDSRWWIDFGITIGSYETLCHESRIIIFIYQKS